MVLVAQPVRADTAKVTAVKLNSTSEGIAIVFSTTHSRRMQVFSFSCSKTFIANIVNTQLQLFESLRERN